MVSGLSLLLSFAYYESHIEETPITKRRRFMAFNTKQLKEINEFELKHIMEEVGDKILPADHPASVRVLRVVRRIVGANADLEEMKGKKFGISVINSPVENAFVLPIGHVFVYAGMLSLCSNDDQLGNILAHEIAHCILSHGAENVSFTHLVDLVSICVIAAIWALFPSDLLSLITQWLFHKTTQILLQLPYNRNIETEADLVGLQLAAKACLDVRESSAFWSKMSFLARTYGQVPEIEFLSTHPSHEARSHYLDSIMEQALKVRVECDCPRLPPRDPRHNIEALNRHAHPKIIK